MFKNIRLSDVAIAFIALIAIFLRLFQISESCLTNDELSALNRLHFQSFSDLITQGVQVDAHPAFTQVLLYYWVKIIGEYSWLIRLPFILFGTTSILFIFSATHRKFGFETALSVGLCLACLPYYIMMSQLARPYAPGIFFVALFYWQITRIEKSAPTKKDLIIAGIALAGAAYTHYVAILTLAFLCIAYFLLYKNVRKAILQISLIGLVVYLPYIPVFLKQVQLGGIGGPGGWLWKPTPSFLFDILYFTSARSILLSAIFVLGFIIALVKSKDRYKSPEMLATIATIVFLYFYSLWKNPVLQYYVLSFSWLFFMPWLFSGIQSFRHKTALIIPACIAIFCLFSLFFQRDYYHRFYEQSYREVVKGINEVKDSSIPVILAGNGEYFYSHYTHQLQCKNPILQYKIDTFNYIDFEKMISKIPGDKLIFGETIEFDRNRLDIIRKYFPKLFTQKLGVEYDLWGFKKAEKNLNPILDTLKPALIFKSKSMYGCEIEMPNPYANLSMRTEIQTHVYMVLNKGENAGLAIACYDKNHKEIYLNYKDFRSFNGIKDTGYVFNHVQIPSTINKSCETIKAYVYNPDQNNIQHAVVELNVFEGNNLQWSVIE